MTDLELDAYYNQVRNYNGKDLSIVLPNNNVFGFEEVMSEIVFRLKEELGVAKSFLDDDISDEERDDALEEIVDLEEKISFCDSYMMRGSQYDNMPRIILAKTEAGNFFFESDFKKVKREKRDELKKIIAYIFGDRSDKSTFSKIMTNNARLKGVIEYKSSQDQIRVYSKRVRGDIIYLFGIVTKKDDWTNGINDTLGKRMNLVNTSLACIRKLDDSEIKKLTDESAPVLGKIMEKVGFTYQLPAMPTHEIEVLDLNEDNAVEKDNDLINPEEWAVIYKIAREIYDEKGFVDLNDPRAQALDLGSWIDQQNENIINGKISKDQALELLSLLSSNSTRKFKVTPPKEDILLTKTIGNLYESLYSLSDEDKKEFENLSSSHHK